jgi:hypothetical protein
MLSRLLGYASRVLSDLDMKKPLAVLGMRGCRAGVPTRLHKEDNTLHTVRVAQRAVALPWLCVTDDVGKPISKRIATLSDAFSGPRVGTGS